MQGCAPCRIPAVERTGKQRSVAFLQFLVILALIGQMKIAPDQPIRDLRPRRPSDSILELSFQDLEPTDVLLARLRDVSCVRIDDRQREIERERRAQ